MSDGELSKRELGRYIEDQAIEILNQRGYILIQRNWWLRSYGEIDIIMAKDQVVCFVEVRGRRMATCTDIYGGAAASLSAEKRRRLRNLATVWLRRNRPDATAELLAFAAEHDSSGRIVNWELIPIM
ncbi:MAG: YraN family protein [Clostridiaceae bacterium]|nr:YraN family protein [Clostridiaceae bacterium]